MTAPSIDPGAKQVIPIGADGTPLTGLATDHGKAEDAAHTTGDKGFQILGVYRAAPVQDAGSAGDYTHPIMDGLGKVWVNPEKTGNYETVAASQTAQVLGATGGAGDFIDHVVVIPATTSPGVVTLLDGATSIAIWVGGTVGADLKPFTIDLGMISASGAWKITTGANVSVIGVGRFT